MCYWRGGGKEGQFPPGFGKRGGFKGTAINTKQGCHDLAKRLSYYLYFFSFLFLFLWTYKLQGGAWESIM